jgi:hypothetical protein
MPDACLDVKIYRVVMILSRSFFKKEVAMDNESIAVAIDKKLRRIQRLQVATLEGSSARCAARTVRRAAVAARHSKAAGSKPVLRPTACGPHPHAAY